MCLCVFVSTICLLEKSAYRSKPAAVSDSSEVQSTPTVLFLEMTLRVHMMQNNDTHTQGPQDPQDPWDSWSNVRPYYPGQLLTWQFEFWELLWNSTTKVPWTDSSPQHLHQLICTCNHVASRASVITYFVMMHHNFALCTLCLTLSCMLWCCLQGNKYLN